MEEQRRSTAHGLLGLIQLLLACCCLSLVLVVGSRAVDMTSEKDDGPSISDATLLLPHATSEGSKISYSIMAFNGCFKW